MARSVDDVLRIMRLAIGRRNAQDPDSSTGTLLKYVQDYMSLSMSDDFKLFENHSSFQFTIDENSTDGIFSFPSTDTDDEDGDATQAGFVNIDAEVFISDPANDNSWWQIVFYQNPHEFYAKWGIDNVDTLTAGYPTDVLYYGNKFIFRTIPDKEYLVQMFGYEQLSDLDETATLPFDYQLRLIAYGAAKQYAADYRLSQETIANIERNYQRERKLVMTRTHNQIKKQRSIPSF